ncbi:MAG: hypothetical protein NC094_11625 [Bacteroidales bacterium]|nr:hypothetical protein [Lachnoclostridium sp.]MCM1385090.1 hypothetical protein [Lachnoclostridium sp.]MCM1466057.1 hypothetical protein [Bacteroidales bacterium]
MKDNENRESNKNNMAGEKWINLVTLLLGEAAMIALFIVYIHWECRLKFGNCMQEVSFILVIGMILIVAAASGSLKELGCAFPYCIMPDSDISASQAGKAVHAVKLAMITSALTGGMITLLNLITVFYTDVNLVTIEEKLYEVGPGQILIASSLQYLLCGIFVAMLFLPIYGRLKRMLSGFFQCDDCVKG